jgi:hypothetical protein
MDRKERAGWSENGRQEGNKADMEQNALALSDAQ